MSGFGKYDWRRSACGDYGREDAVCSRGLVHEHDTGFPGMYRPLTDITGSHYGPNIEASAAQRLGRNGTSTMPKGIGMDRTVATGTGFVGQYPPQVARMYESPGTNANIICCCFFITCRTRYKLHSGETVIQYLLRQSTTRARRRRRNWARSGQHSRAASIRRSSADVACASRLPGGTRDLYGAVLYLCSIFFSRAAFPMSRGGAGHYPGRLEVGGCCASPGYKVIDVTPWEDASGGKALSCQATTSQPAEQSHPRTGLYHATPSELAETSHPTRGLYQGTTSVVPKSPQNESGASALDGAYGCSAEWTWKAAPGRFDVAIEYFDLRGGVAKFSLSVNGKPVAAWTADRVLPSKSRTQITPCGTPCAAWS